MRVYLIKPKFAYEKPTMSSILRDVHNYTTRNVILSYIVEIHQLELDIPHPETKNDRTICEDIYRKINVFEFKGSEYTIGSNDIIAFEKSNNWLLYRCKIYKPGWTYLESLTNDEFLEYISEIVKMRFL